MELESWSQQKEQRIAGGDDLSVAREVTQFADFKSKKDAKEPMSSLEAVGYRVSSVRKVYLVSASLRRSSRL